MYVVKFTVKCKSSLDGFDVYSVPCSCLEIALALASFLGKASNEPGANLVYESVSVEPIKIVEHEKKS